MAATIVTNAAGQSYANLAADYADYGTMTATVNVRHALPGV